MIHPITLTMVTVTSLECHVHVVAHTMCYTAFTFKHFDMKKINNEF